MSDQLTETFKEEASDLLNELENALLELDKTPGDKELVSAAFRALHTIKGGGSMFGFEAVSKFSHEIEQVFDHVRSGTVAMTRELIDLTLEAKDFIRLMLEQGEIDEAGIRNKNQLLAAFKAVCPQTAAGEKDTAAPEPPPEAPPVFEGKYVTYRIQFKPHPRFSDTGIELFQLIDELKSLGSTSLSARLNDIPPVHNLEPAECYVSWDIFLTTDKGINGIKDVFIFVEDDADIVIDAIDEVENGLADPDYKKLGYILVDRGVLSNDDMSRILHNKKLFGELLLDEGLVAEEDIRSALLEQQHVRDARLQKIAEESISTLKVASSKVDDLVNMVGELVTVQARLVQLAGKLEHSELLSISKVVERLVINLREKTMNIRMVPLNTIFNKFNRIVRDLSREMGKQAELIIEGATTELDKTVIEKINDPLVHVLRNSVDHGLEPAEKRKQEGKDETGIIRISARQEGAFVLITIEDDGAGLDVAKIKAKALERGVISHDAQLSPQEVFHLIFEPGFSTAQSVTSVSGRGVGMDVVKKKIDELRGSINVKSEQGKGTAITLKIPLTLAIVDGLLVDVAGKYYVFPLSMVEKCVELSNGREKLMGKGSPGHEDKSRRQIIDYQGEIVPYIRLRDSFRCPGEFDGSEKVVIADINGSLQGFVVDEVVGQHQTVIKPLNRVYRNVKNISGATILGDGTVALIVDLNQVSGAAARDEKQRSPGGNALT